MDYREAYEAAKAYADERLSEVRKQIEALREEVSLLREKLQAHAVVRDSMTADEIAGVMVERQIKTLREDIIQTLLDHGYSFEVIGAALPKIDKCLEPVRAKLMPETLAHVMLVQVLDKTVDTG